MELKDKIQLYLEDHKIKKSSKAYRYFYQAIYYILDNDIKKFKMDDINKHLSEEFNETTTNIQGVVYYASKQYCDCSPKEFLIRAMTVIRLGVY